MMDLNTYSESSYMAKEDVPEEGVVLQIDRFSNEVMRDETEKPAIWFVEEGYKPLLLNATNRNRLIAIFDTSDTSDLVGRKITVYCDPLVEFGGKIVGGVRIRKAKKDKGASKAKPGKSKQIQVPQEVGQRGGSR